ncbi:MAG: thiamine-phosphate kinase [Deltaproteobacteria bacterium]|nr:thiamine-phosphate kinase [Deltaproteobacteria bacterium]MBW2445012.1 thiamine-phosphate kinase [Deltaproteobacteria bacterium]
MNLGELTEFGWIDRIRRAAERAGVPRHVVVGIGDDAAVLRPRAREDVVVSTDALVEDAHFRWRTDPGRQVGRRAVAASLSDLAAMGARPLGVTVAFAGPAELPVRRLDAVTAGLLDVCTRCDAPLVGGNVARARKTSLTVTALGAVRRGQALRRGSARVGDRLLVTGRLGEAALSRARAGRTGRVMHTPEPRLQAGQALARAAWAGACIDLSDGLVADLGHLLEASGVGARVAVADAPRRKGFDAACRRARLDPARTLLAGGEDYELLFTVRRHAPSVAVLARRLGVAVTEVGEIVARGLHIEGAAQTGRGGFRHF